MTFVQTPTIAKLTSALPFWISILLIPIAIFSASAGGFVVADLYLVSVFDC